MSSGIVNEGAGGDDSVVGLVVVTHGGCGACLLSAAAEIVGPLDASSSVAVVVGEDYGDVLSRVGQACDAVEGGAGLLILVDVHGSSEFQACLAMVDGSRPVEIVCGVNLPMLLKLATLDRHTLGPAALADYLKEVGKRSIRLGSELTGKITTQTHAGPGDSH
ncbi:MAG: system fructose subfamily component [Myxococcales bacterium]|nr:system fructose subfamily component [Myxococcales bacterium]